MLHFFCKLIFTQDRTEHERGAEPPVVPVPPTRVRWKKLEPTHWKVDQFLLKYNMNLSEIQRFDSNFFKRTLDTQSVND